MTENKEGNKLLEKCIVHLPVEGVTLNDDVDVSLATIGDDWIEPGFQRKSLVHQVLLLLDKVEYAVIGDFQMNQCHLSC